MRDELEGLVVRESHRIPIPAAPAGDGAAAARQFDAVLMSAGFKLSGEALERLSALDAGPVIELAARVLDVVRRMVGDHVSHNVYFRDFPANVPGTLEFWAGLLEKTFLGGATAAARFEGLNLLALPGYGRYLHSYKEMVAAHKDLIPAASDRITILHIGGSLEEETTALYRRLASSAVPLGDTLPALQILAAVCHDVELNEIPLRENRAVINAERIHDGAPPFADTVTDVLRLACALSNGDPTLRTPSQFRIGRPARRLLLAALDEIVTDNPAKLGDVAQYREEWKRLGEYLHPHEYPHLPGAARVFAVARGEERMPSFSGRLEQLVSEGDVQAAARLLQAAPGMLVRSLDRLLRTAAPKPGEALLRTSLSEQADAVVDALDAVAGDVSGRVLLSLREHLVNRVRPGIGPRVFPGRGGRAAVVADTRPALDLVTVGRLCAIIDGEIGRRLPRVGHVVVDPAVLDVALPLTGTSRPSGFGTLPRGSITPVDGGLLRFFVYWREARHRTDYDLSALLLADGYRTAAHIGFTNLAEVGAVHSGDITSAPDGASEFIDVDLAAVPHRYVIPQVNVYAGEGFDEVAESFFGFMIRDRDQEGRPFEPRTVRLKSELRGTGRVALPIAFVHESGGWTARWLHVHLRGRAAFNQVEGNDLSTAALVRGILEREYLRVRYLLDLWAAGGTPVTLTGEPPSTGDAVTYVGIDAPETLPEGSTIITLREIQELIPA